jgi:uncharacterized membrane protein (DUF2068 family)
LEAHSRRIFHRGRIWALAASRHHNVVDFLNAHIIIPYHLNPENRAIYWLLDKADALTSHRLLLLGYAAFFYAALFAAEGIGLYLRKHWAEYLVVIVTASLLPIEVYELCVKLALWKFAAVVGNLLIVALSHPSFAAGRPFQGPTTPRPRRGEKRIQGLRRRRPKRRPRTVVLPGTGKKCLREPSRLR